MARLDRRSRSRAVVSAAMLPVLVALQTGSLAPPAHAFFEGVRAGARGTAIGEAYTAMADDASAVYWNPAGLATMRRGEVLLLHRRPYVVENLQSNFISVVGHRGRSSFALAWHRTSVQDVISEDILYLGYARDLLPYGRTYAASVGGNLKVASVGFSSSSEVDYGRITRYTADLAALVNVSSRLSLGYVVRNVVEPEFDFVDGSGGSRLERSQDVGLAYRWHPDLTFAASLARDAVGSWSANTGVEVWFFDVFGLRSGISDGEFVGGVGLKTARYLVDVGFETQSELGISYELSLRIPWGGERW